MKKRFPGKVVDKTNFDRPFRQIRDEAKRRATRVAVDLRSALREQLSTGAGSYPIKNDTGTASSSFYILTATRNDYARRRAQSMALYTAKRSSGSYAAPLSHRPGGGGFHDRKRVEKYQHEQYSVGHFNVRALPQVSLPVDTPTQVNAVVASFWKPMGYWEYGHRNYFIYGAKGGQEGANLSVESPFIRMTAITFKPLMPAYFRDLLNMSGGDDPFGDD